jgi:hypothetical protein
LTARIGSGWGAGFEQPSSIKLAKIGDATTTIDL